MRLNEAESLSCWLDLWSPLQGLAVCSRGYPGLGRPGLSYAIPPGFDDDNPKNVASKRESKPRPFKERRVGHPENQRLRHPSRMVTSELAMFEVLEIVVQYGGLA